MGSIWSAVVIDSTDPARLSRWWAEVLSYQILDEHADEVMVGAGDDTQPQLFFVRRSEADQKPGKNRLHLDLSPDDRDAEVERLVNMGARHVENGPDERSWVVLADPEGNEFFVLASG